METLLDLPLVDEVLATFLRLGEDVSREVGGLGRDEAHGLVLDDALLYVEVTQREVSTFVRVSL